MGESFDDALRIGGILRQRRRLLRLTLQDVSDLAGCHPNWLSQVERGKGTAQIGMIAEAARVLGLRLSLEEVERDE
ncbi:MAG: helix-turn-helix transcriptional regulator [Fimbriimonadaceae bacterium]|nr:helix-turn-helix transcriptional regulator [Fimbriimonadaceae bacterium]